MGLQVWLSLNGNLNNQGLSNAAATNNGATVDNNGKIGKCYSFSGSNYVTLPTTFLSDFTNEISVCAWINISAWNSQYDSIIKMYAGNNAWNNSIFAMGRNGTTSRLYFSIANGTSSTQSSCSLTEDQSLNTWYHIACVYNNTDKNMKIYLNGVLKTTYNTTIVPSFSSVTSVGIGGSPLASYGLKGKLNDIRIYNYALSAQEIKLISQGLILHYPLDRNNWGQDNILTNSTGYEGTSGWSGLVTNGEENGEPYLVAKRTDTTSASRTFCTHAAITSLVSSWHTGDSFTISGWYKVPSSETYDVTGNMFIRWTHSTGGSSYTDTGFSTISASTITKDTWIRFENTYSVPANYVDGSVNFYLSAFSKGLSTIYWKNVKLEYGNKATAWTPSISDTLYTTMDIGSTTEHDISGYQNNGTRNGSFVWISDTPKYSLSTNFTGTQYILSDSPSTNGATLSAWVKTTSTSNQALMIDYKSGLGIGFWSSVIIPSCNSSIKTTYPVSNYSVNQWNHIAVVKNTNSSILCYVNGVLQSATSTLDYWSTGVIDGLSIASRPNGASPATCKISDVRIYTTALSADDILELYNNKVI